MRVCGAGDYEVHGAEEAEEDHAALAPGDKGSNERCDTDLMRWMPSTDSQACRRWKRSANVTNNGQLSNNSQTAINKRSQKSVRATLEIIEVESRWTPQCPQRHQKPLIQKLSFRTRSFGIPAAHYIDFFSFTIGLSCTSWCNSIFSLFK